MLSVMMKLLGSLFLLLVFCRHAEGVTAKSGCKVDVCLILDESGSVGSTNFQLNLEFLAEFVSSLTISDQTTRVGLVKFSSYSQSVFSLDTYSSAADLKSAILAVSYGGGGTSIHAGLKTAREECFNAANGDRADASNVAVLFTDGKSDPQLADQEATLLRNTGASVMVIGIGGGVDRNTLLSIADTEANLFSVTDFDRLIDNTHELLGRVCDAEEVCLGVDWVNWNSGSYPPLYDCPRLSNPIKKNYNDNKDDGSFFVFECTLKYNGTNGGKTPKFVFTFLFDGVADPNLSPTIVDSVSDPVILHQRSLVGHLGKMIQCQAETYWDNDPTSRSSTLVSRSYFAGLAASVEHVDIYESDPSPRAVLIYSTLPVYCPTTATPGCSIVLPLIASTGSAAFYQRHDKYPEIKIRKCHYSIARSDWYKDTSIAYNAERPLLIQVHRDVFLSPDSELTMSFGDITETPALNDDASTYELWKDYHPKPLRVSVHPSKKRSCRTTGDPQINTLDGKSYPTAAVGTFKLVKVAVNQTSDVEVQVRSFPCKAGEDPTSCSVICGVAVYEAGGTLIVDSCSGASTPNVIKCTDTTDDIISISGDATYSKYQIITQSGVRVKIELLSRGMNLFVRLPASFKNNVYGMCGNYNDNPDDDLLIKSTGSYATTHQETDLFMNDLSVSDADNLFMCPTSHPPEDIDDYLAGLKGGDGFCQCKADGKQYSSSKTIPKNICGLTSTESGLADMANPTDVKVVALIPSFLKHNSVTRQKRSLTTLTTDYIDYSYDPWGTSWTGSYNSMPPPWNTFGISESEAQTYCEVYLKASEPYKACKAFVSDKDFAAVVEKCVSDIQRSGDYSWAHNKVYEFQDICVESFFDHYNASETYDPQVDPVFQKLFDNILDTFCPNNCSSHGWCSQGLCNCTSGYIGADCSLTKGTSPTIQKYLDADECDATESYCTSTWIQAENLVVSESLTCLVTYTTNDGSISSLRNSGEMFSHNSVRCTLPDFQQIGTSEIVSYTYHVTLSNDGVHFSQPLSTNRVVHRSTDIWSSCLAKGIYKPKTATCSINDVCYEEGYNRNDCERCSPKDSSFAWTQNPIACPNIANTQPTGYGPWSQFSSCSKHCDFGLMTRYTSCIDVSLCGNRVVKQSALCNKFSCEEVEFESAMATVLILKNVDMDKVVNNEAKLLNAISEVLNNNSQTRQKQLCDAVDLRSLNYPAVVGKVFSANHTKLATGYPRILPSLKNVMVKVLVKVVTEHLRGVCEFPHMRRRAVQEKMTVVKPTFVAEILKENEDKLEEILGMEISVTSDDEQEETDSWFLLYVLLPTGLLLITGIILIAVSAHKGIWCFKRHTPRVGSKDDLNDGYRSASSAKLFGSSSTVSGGYIDAVMNTGRSSLAPDGRPPTALRAAWGVGKNKPVTMKQKPSMDNTNITDGTLQDLEM